MSSLSTVADSLRVMVEDPASSEDNCSDVLYDDDDDDDVNLALCSSFIFRRWPSLPSSQFFSSTVFSSWKKINPYSHVADPSSSYLQLMILTIEQCSSAVPCRSCAAARASMRSFNCSSMSGMDAYLGGTTVSSSDHEPCPLLTRSAFVRRCRASR